MLKKTLLAIALTFAMLALISLPAAALQKGETLPELKGKTIEGTDFDLSAFKGEPILLKIGTTWCGACRMQTKAISGISDYLKENKVRFVDVFLQESEKTVRKYFAEDGYELPETIVLDEGDIHKNMNVYLVPRVILIDKNYKVYRDGNSISSTNLKKMLEAMLAND
jgi:thiol-disulfide isomerase/thioredoxin